jgi:hypothetical protein
VLFDTGSLFIRDDLAIIDAFTGDELASLATHPKHVVSRDSLGYHRDHWTDS